MDSPTSINICRRERQTERANQRYQTRLGDSPSTGLTLKTAICHSCELVGRMTNNSAPISVLVRLSSCWVTLRTVLLRTARFWSSVLHHWTYLWPQGAVPPHALIIFGGVTFIAWRRRGPMHFWDCRTHLKTVLCHTRTLGRTYDIYQCTNQRDTITCDTICVVDG